VIARLQAFSKAVLTLLDWLALVQEYLLRVQSTLLPKFRKLSGDIWRSGLIGTVLLASLLELSDACLHPAIPDSAFSSPMPQGVENNWAPHDV